MPRNFVVPAECPVCGEAVPRHARACPGCGADERSGWNEEARRYDGLDLPSSAFEDESEQKPVLRGGKNPLGLMVTVVVLLAVIAAFIFR